MRILVARRDSFGDVLCTTPILRRLRRENPNATINVHTWYPYVFAGNDDVDLASNGNDLHARRGHTNLFTGPAPGTEYDLSGNYDRVIDLNLAFEKRFRKMRAVDAYMEEAFGDTGDDAEKGVVLADVPCPEIAGLDVKDAVVMHPARSEKCRTLPHGFWQELVRVLRARGRRIVTVGTSQDYDLDGVDADTKNRLTPQMQAALIRKSACLVASESGILGGILPATLTPAVGLMTISLPDVGGPYRMGGYGKRFWPIMARVDCVGCAARYKEVITAHGCLEDRDYECVRTFDPMEVADRVEEAAATDRSTD